MLAIIRDEFEEEIGQQKILLTSYKDQWNREQPMFELYRARKASLIKRE